MAKQHNELWYSPFESFWFVAYSCPILRFRLSKHRAFHDPLADELLRSSPPIDTTCWRPNLGGGFDGSLCQGLQRCHAFWKPLSTLKSLQTAPLCNPWWVVVHCLTYSWWYSDHKIWRSHQILWCRCWSRQGPENFGCLGNYLPNNKTIEKVSTSIPTCWQIRKINKRLLIEMKCCHGKPPGPRLPKEICRVLSFWLM